ncbi:MAG: hypothetical protein J6P02_02590 [Lachnospiraceae bacterium]|nr:hypothetical protein [Lachnospiraceae bacterium]
MSIENMLDDFINSNHHKVVAIDGPWGCGKTTVIYRFIKKYEKKFKISYVSLFGSNNIDEINTKLYYYNNRIKNKVLNGISVISKAIDVVALKSIRVSSVLENILNLHSKNIKVIKNIVIFDDFERMSQIGYDEIMGYFNNLIFQGCKIICVMSSNNIFLPEKDKYERFKEKIFDRVYKIDIFNNNIFNELFSDLNINGIEKNYYLFNNNIRLANKVKELYLRISNHVNSKNIRIVRNDEYLLFLACIYSVLSIFGINTIEELCNNFLKDSNNDISDIKKSYNYYDMLIRSSFATFYDEVLITNLRKMFNIPNVSKELQLTGFLDLLKSVIKILIRDDFSDFDYFFYASKDNDFKYLNKEFFYLSDDEKKNYYDEFISLICKKQVKWSENLTKCFCDICLYSNLDISEKILDHIADCILCCEEKENKKLNFFDLISMRLESNTSFKFSKNKDVLVKLKEAYTKQNSVNLQNKFDIAATNAEYIDLAGFLSFDYKDNLWLIEKLKNNNYYLPNLCDSITFEQWKYCHVLSRFLSNTELKYDYIKLLINLVNNNKENFSLNDRVLTLLEVVCNIHFNSLEDFYNSNCFKNTVNLFK